jgi:hypothetical protein
VAHFKAVANLTPQVVLRPDNPSRLSTFADYGRFAFRERSRISVDIAWAVNNPHIDP